MGSGLRETLTGAAIRSIAGIVDMGEVLAAFVSNLDGGSVNEVDTDKKDVHVHARENRIDASTTDGGRPLKARLFFAGNALFRLTKKGDSVTVIRPADTDGPGALVALHGDGGAKNTVPGWVDDRHSGTSVAEAWIVESTGDSVTIRANTGTAGSSASVTLNNNGSIDLTPAAGKTVNVGGTSYSLPQWETFSNAMTTWVTAIQTAFNAIQTPLGFATTAPQLAVAAACGTLLGLLGGSTFKSQNAKNG